MAAEANHGGARQRWLIVGHGSVGSFVATRIARLGYAVHVLDPNPRVALPEGVVPADAVRVGDRFDHIVSCVPPDAAEAVPALVQDRMRDDSFFFDWNTLSPDAKARVGDALPVTMVDVALLDSLDAVVDLPNLAVSGARITEAAATLRRLGFMVAVAGENVGDAAALKYLRSIFMKTLEALVVEYASLSASLDRKRIVRESIENNLGPRFGEFMDLLVRTNRIHSDRRSRELADAVAILANDGVRPQLAAAGVEVLSRCAEAWSDESAPPPGSDPTELANYLQSVLWPQPAST